MTAKTVGFYTYKENPFPYVQWADGS
jgi:hypothetical protein